MELRLHDVAFVTDNQTLLAEIECTIEPRTVTIIIGPGGSGKTLLLKVMAGIIPPTRGTVSFDGQSLDTMSAAALQTHRLKQGFVFQDAALWQNLSVQQNLALPVQFHFPRRPMAEINARIGRLCQAMAFKEDLSQRPSRLSAGEQKTASFLRALMLDPQTLFMDEPSSALDTGSRENMLQILRELKDRERTMIIASHDGKLASMLADRIIVIDDGRIIAHDSVQNLVHSAGGRVRELLSSILNLTSTYDADILEILGSGDVDPFG